MKIKKPRFLQKWHTNITDRKKLYYLALMFVYMAIVATIIVAFALFSFIKEFWNNLPTGIAGLLNVCLLIVVLTIQPVLKWFGKKLDS